MSRRRSREGYLNVKQSGRSAFGKSWKRKWVIVHPNNTRSQVGELAAPSIVLELYLEKGVYGKVNSVLIEGATDVNRIYTRNQPLAFEIRGKDKVLISAAAESETETQEWIAMFKQQLLPVIRKKELSRLPDANEDAYSVSIIPNKYSEGLRLSGVMLAHVTKMNIGLYDLYEGTLVREWDLRHTKRFSLQSKVHTKDVDRVAVIQISNRCPYGNGDLQLYSLNAKALLEKIYEKLNSAMNVKSKRTRTSSMLFEIPPKELEALGREIKEERPVIDAASVNVVEKDAKNGTAQKELNIEVPSVNSETGKDQNSVGASVSETGEGMDVTGTDDDVFVSSDKTEITDADITKVKEVERPSEKQHDPVKDELQDGEDGAPVLSSSLKEVCSEDNTITQNDKTSNGVANSDAGTDITEDIDAPPIDASDEISQKVDETNDISGGVNIAETCVKDDINIDKQETVATNKGVDASNTELNETSVKKEDLPEVNVIDNSHEINNADTMPSAAEHREEEGDTMSSVAEHREEEGDTMSSVADHCEEEGDMMSSVAETTCVKDDINIDKQETVATNKGIDASNTELNETSVKKEDLPEVVNVIDNSHEINNADTMPSVAEHREEEGDTMSSVADHCEEEGDTMSRVAEHREEKGDTMASVAEHREEEDESQTEKAEENEEFSQKYIEVKGESESPSEKLEEKEVSEESSDVKEEKVCESKKEEKAESSEVIGQIVKDEEDKFDGDLCDVGPSESGDKPSVCEEHETEDRNETVESEQLSLVKEKTTGDASEKKNEGDQEVENKTIDNVSSESKTKEYVNNTTEEPTLKGKVENVQEESETQLTQNDNTEAYMSTEEPTKSDDADTIEAKTEETTKSENSSGNHVNTLDTTIDSNPVNTLDTAVESSHDTAVHDTVDPTNQSESNTSRDTIEAVQ